MELGRATLDRASQYLWNIEVADHEVGSAPTTLARGELRMLHWLAREFDSDGDIVDAGCFLGGSTLALATGLKANPESSPERRIHTYDKFMTIAECLVDLSAGDSFLPVFRANLADYLNLIEIHAATSQQPSSPRGISILSSWTYRNHSHSKPICAGASSRCSCRADR
jgi:hypothetical protein